ncbi:MAG: hypothetical protein H6628_09370 [Calditrichae bacterium]|nr:hypothetical protein [Calditrichia bacterium]
MYGEDYTLYQLNQGEESGLTAAPAAAPQPLPAAVNTRGETTVTKPVSGIKKVKGKMKD